MLYSKKLFKHDNKYVFNEYLDEDAQLFSNPHHGYITEWFYGPQAKIINGNWYIEYICPTGNEPSDFVLEYIDGANSVGWIVLDTNNDKKYWWIAIDNLIKFGEPIVDNEVYNLIGWSVEKNIYQLTEKEGHHLIKTLTPIWTTELPRDFKSLKRFLFEYKTYISPYIGHIPHARGLLFIKNNTIYNLSRTDFVNNGWDNYQQEIELENALDKLQRVKKKWDVSYRLF